MVQLCLPDVSRSAGHRPTLDATFQHGQDGWHKMPGSAAVMALGRIVNREDAQINCDQIGDFTSTGSPAVVVPFDQSMNPAETLPVGVQQAEQITVVVGDAARSGNLRRFMLHALRHWVRRRRCGR